VLTAQDAGKSAILAVAPRTLETSHIFMTAESATHRFMGLPSNCGDPLYITGVTVHAFRNYRKKKSFLFGREPPMHH